MSTSESQQPNPANKSSYPNSFVAWYTTVLLALLYWLSLLDRSIISLLVDPIKKDLGISDVQFGMLHGMAFAITFSIFGLIVGTVADRFSRRTIIYISVTIWSLATAACGAAANFVHLLLARVGVGAGEAGLNPCASSMITDLFPPKRLTLALAVYALGSSVGVGCAFLFGGMLVDAVSNTEYVQLPVLGDVKPWQAVFYIIGLPGVFIALLSFTMPEPKRRGVRNKQQSGSIVVGVVRSYSDLLRFMGQRKKFFSHHYLGFGLASICFTGGAAWYPAHIARTFGWEATQVGLSLGIALVAGGFVGKFFTGTMIGKLYERGHKDAQFKWYGWSLIVAFPLGIIAMVSHTPWVFFVFFFFYVALLSPLTAVYVASLNLVTPNELRGAGVAFFGTVAGIISLSAGPVLIAMISDYVFGGNAIGYGMATLFGVICPIAAYFLLTGCNAMREAVIEAESWNSD